MRVAILDDIHQVYEKTAGVRRLREIAEVRIFTGPFGDPSALRGFDALVTNRERTKITRALLEQLPDLKIIAQTGNHVYHIDMAAAAECGVIIGKAAGGFSRGTAELTFGLAIALLRGIPASDRAVRRGEWHTPMTFVLHEKTLGIVGLGQIGRYVAQIAAAFGMRVLAWSPRLTEERAQAVGAHCVPLDDLMRESDIVSVHLKLAPESRGLIDARRIGLMKPTAYLVNTARGAIVDEAALATALAEQRIAGAGLDVFTEEPLPAGHPLTTLPNVILTAHLGWPTDEAYERFADSAADVLIAYHEGREVPQYAERR